MTATPRAFEWRLQQAMKNQGIYQNAELRRRLSKDGIDLSTSQVHRLVTSTPDRLNLAVLASLCRILGVTPAELIEVDFTAAFDLERPAADGSNVVDLASQIRPKRARIQNGKG